MMKSEEQIREDWYKFGNNAFIEWRGPTRRTLTEFAHWVDNSQPVMSQQLKKGGSVPRDQKTIAPWVNRYGNIVYEILDLPIPEDPLNNLPRPLQEIAREFREKVAEYRFAGDSPEASKLLDEIMKEHGYKKINTSSPEGDK